MSIGLAIIALNEEESLPTLLVSIEGSFDRVVLLDTGSTDKTKDVFTAWARAQSGMTYSVGDFEWVSDFSLARIAADELLLGTGETPLVDWKCWADCDDTIRGAEQLRKIVNNAPAEVLALVFGYDYAQHPETGITVCHLRRERLVRAGHGKWIGRVHEAQTIDGPISVVPDEVVQWVHHKQALDENAAIASNERNLKILLDWAIEAPNDPRVLGYCGKELAAHDEHDRALEFYERYMQQPIGWSDERAQTYRHYARSLFALNRPVDDIERLALEAMREHPRWPDTWLTLAECSLLREKLDNGVFYAQRALELGCPFDSMLIVNPLDYTAYPHRLIAGALGQGENFDEAIKHAELSLQINTGDAQLRQMWAGWKFGAKRIRTADTYAMCAEQLIAHDEQLKAKTLLEECVPYFATDHPRIVQLRMFLRNRLAWVEDPEAFEDHYNTGGSKPEDFHADEQSDLIAQQLPRVEYLIENLLAAAA